MTPLVLATGNPTPARRAMKAAVLVNIAAGVTGVQAAKDSAEVARVEEAFARARVAAEVRGVVPARLQEAVKAAVASDADVVVIGGGDGTLNAAARVLTGGKKPMGVLPLGTLNHFARDLGIPGDLDAAVGTIAAGHVRQVDVGEANGRIFLNNCSIGLYPHVVRGREELRHRYGQGKWIAMLQAAVAVLRRYPVVEATLRVGERAASFRTPFVFVGNNAYAVSLYGLGRRERLDGGELGLYFSRDGGRLGLLRLAVLALIGRLEQDRDFTSRLVPAVEIDTRRRLLRVAVDGELTIVTPPLRCRSRPRALRVLVPAPEPPAPPAADPAPSAAEPPSSAT
jgi:diacylglycerol kinase family enzyme